MAHDPIFLSRRTIVGLALVATPVAVASVAALTAVRPVDGSDTIHLFDIVPASLQADIVNRKIDNTLTKAMALSGHIQRAIDIAARDRKRLIVPKGLYNLAPVESFASEAGACRRCFAIRNDMRIDAEDGATFRIVDGVSTDRSVVFMCMFGSNEQLRNLSWRGLAMDMNGQHNPISPQRASGQYSLLNQAHIFISGTPRGQAALATGVRIDGCRFTNTAGVSCLVLAQSNAPGVALGRDWQISDCDFIDGGLDTPDHSAIYAWAQDVLCQRCRFTNAIAKTTVGGNVAFEVHGSRQRFINNVVSRYYQGVWIDGNKSEDIATDIIVSHNVLNAMSGYGIMFFGETSRTSRVAIIGNKIVFDDSIYPGVDIKIGIGCLSLLPQSHVTIRQNSVSARISKTASAGFTLQSGGDPDAVHDDFVVADNIFIGTTFGSQIVTNARSGLGTITLDSNICRNLSRGGAFSTPQGIGVDFNGRASPIRKLVMRNNACVDDRKASAQCAFGIRVQGRIGDLVVAGNSATGMTVAPYAEGSLAVARRMAAAG